MNITDLRPSTTTAASSARGSSGRPMATCTTTIRIAVTAFVVFLLKKTKKDIYIYRTN
nr:MAG TPA: hypothetical protein [Caudoviricetes sp.]